MWSFASKAFRGSIRLKNGILKQNNQVPSSDCSDDELSLNNTGEEDEGLECPICWESFNVVENVPYVLWCGHTLCKNCVLGLQRAVVKLPTLPIQLPFFISCPWCNLLSFRLVCNGNVRFPCKNYFLLWMVERMNGDRSKSCIYKDHHHHQQQQHSVGSLNRNSGVGNQIGQVSNRRNASARRLNHDDRFNVGYFNAERFQLSIRESLVFFVHLTAKFPLIVIFLLIVLYAIPASAAILALYVLITILFALPCFLILYFAFPSLDWLVREIIT